jgi:hypothetical protein
MTHYRVGVVIPKRITGKLKQTWIETVMAPYNEQDEAYFTEHDCTEALIKEQKGYASGECKMKDGHIPTVKELSEIYSCVERDGKYYEKYNSNAKYDYYTMVEEVTPQHLLKQTRECAEGLTEEWNDIMNDTDPRNDCRKQYYKERYHSLEDYLEFNSYENMPWAILSPENEWIEAGRVGWFGSDNADYAGIMESMRKKKAVLEADKDTCTVVLLDCHI